MTLVGAWVAFPAVFVLVTVGCGLLIERVSGASLAGVLVAPLGLAVVVVASQITTYFDGTAEFTTPTVVALALAGVWVGRARILRPGWDGAAGAVALGVFATFAAPVVLSGQATFAGYGLLGDTAVHFVLIDHVLEHGRDVGDLKPSSYSAAIRAYLDTAYPLGAQTALGALRPLVGQDVAWIFQPYLALLSACSALALYGIMGPYIPTRPLRGSIAFVAGQSGLVYAYALQGSIKELATVWVLLLLVGLLVPFLHGRESESVIPLSVASAAAIGVISLSVVPWLGPLLAVWVGAVVWRRRGTPRRRAARDVALLSALVGVLSAPALSVARTFVEQTTATVTSKAEFGNLLGSLRWEQMFGIWPRGDYRFPLGPTAGLGYALIGVAVVGCALGVCWLVRARAKAPTALVGVSVIGWIYVTRRGSPWADAKALMILSPAIVLLAMCGTAALYESRRRVEGSLLAAALAFGVLWTNALAYHDADLAPRDRMEELADIGVKLAGKGPTLYPEFEEFGKHFLRDAAPTGPSENAQPSLVVTRRGSEQRFGFSRDLDGLGLDYVERFRAIVMRRSPTASRPPANYSRTFIGHYYEIWQRRQDSVRVLEHLPIGSDLQASARPVCADAASLADKARRNGGRLAYAALRQAPVFIAAEQILPPKWTIDPNDGHSVRPDGAGRLNGSVRVQHRGTYDLWLQGSFGRRVAVVLDGRSLGLAREELSGRGQYLYLASVVLARGLHSLALVRPGGDLRPGTGGADRLIGPLMFSPVENRRRGVREATPSHWRGLCDRSLDWIEIVK